jgi:hypothetical protein
VSRDDYELAQRMREQALYRDRRERIATAAMAGLLAKYGIDDSDGEMLDEAVKYADGLIKRLDKEVQP